MKALVGGGAGLGIQHVMKAGKKIIIPLPTQAFASEARSRRQETGRCAGVGGCSSVDILARTLAMLSLCLHAASW